MMQLDYSKPILVFNEYTQTLGIRFNESNGLIPQYIDLGTNTIKIFIPFENGEKVCWDCGKNRELEINLDFEGNYIFASEVCT